MKNRAILAREKAKQGTLIVPEKIKEDPKIVELGKLTTTDPNTKKVIEVFDSFEAAIEKGFSGANIKKALKGKTKYKGYLWTSENELT
jgi:hypothetical protein